MTKERPILFSAPMVRAFLDGRKTQTRRAVKLKPQPSNRGDWTVDTIGGDGVKDAQGNDAPVMPCMYHTGTGRVETCPYGQPGDRLWVKENLKFDVNDSRWKYRADDKALVDVVGRELETPTPERWPLGVCNSIHLPRYASRIQLEITAIRVERLNDISETDAIAEGIEPHLGGWMPYNGCLVWIGENADIPGAAFKDPRHSFESLWKKINGFDSWAANPWVWVVEFKRVMK